MEADTGGMMIARNSKNEIYIKLNLTTYFLPSFLVAMQSGYEWRGIAGAAKRSKARACSPKTPGEVSVSVSVSAPETATRFSVKA